MQDGKFHPHTEHKKGVRKSRDQTTKTQGVRLKRLIQQKNNKNVEISNDEVTIFDNNGQEVVKWISDEWKEDPSIIPAIKNAVKLANQGKIGEIKKRIGFIERGTVERKARAKVKAELLTPMELFNHPFLEESTEWLRTFADNPKLSVADEKHDRFWIWFGGRMIHEFRPDGEQVDAFTVGGSKEGSLTTKEVISEFERELNKK